MKTTRVPFFLAAFLAVALLTGTSQAQAPTLPIDFESTTVNYTFTNFDGGVATVINNPQIGGINTSAKVAQMVKGAGQPWAGAYLTLAAPIDFSVNKFFKVKVFMPRAGAKLLLKVENLDTTSVNFEKEVTGTVANGWEELTFDYSAISTTNGYSKIVFIFDLGTVGNGTPAFTYLFDDIRLTTGTPPPPDTTQMNLPVTFDIPWVNYGLVGFGGAENSTIVDDPTMANNKVAKVVKSATAELWAGTTITAVSGATQTGFRTKVPFTETEKRMNVRVWSPHAGIQVRLKVEDYSATTISCETEATVTIANQWQTLVFDFANHVSGTAPLNLANNYNKASLFFNFGVTGATAGERIYYFDDVKFGMAVIPVELTSFTASVSENIVTLNWATATETNNKGFEVERSSDNGSFEAIAFVNGNGTTTETRSYSYSDVISNGSYTYRLKQIDFDGSFTYSQTLEANAAPSEFSLGQNYPNPFNPSTMISFSLPFESKVSMTIYNTLGEAVSELVNGTFSAGRNQVSFNASLLTSGIYFYSITASAVDGSQTFRSMKKMILTK